MNYSEYNSVVRSLDAKRDLALPGNFDQTIDFCTQYLINQSQKAIVHKGFFTIALSGGSTPKAIFNKMKEEPFKSKVEWDKILFFFGDERCVPPDHPDSNYKMAVDTALKELKVPTEHIFRMVAEKDAKENAMAYQKLIEEKVPQSQFDLITLGMGDDGHTASLFPHTQALAETDKLVVVNQVPQKDTSRMTFTYPCINQAHKVCFFVLGKAKASILPHVLQGEYNPLKYPSQKVGSSAHKALWILDKEASSGLSL